MLKHELLTDIVGVGEEITLGTLFNHVPDRGMIKYLGKFTAAALISGKHYLFAKQVCLGKSHAVQ